MLKDGKVDLSEIIEEHKLAEGSKIEDVKELQSIIEGILFTMGDSVPIEQIAMAIDQDQETTRKIINQMKDNYNQQHHGIMIMELENSYQMCTKKEIYEYLVKIAKQPRKYLLTDVLLETLSIIAYKQPVTKLEIEKIRGVKSDHSVNKLVEFTLVEEVGRLDAPGRPLQFGTTEEFLRRFGVSSMEDLPVIQPNQMEDFKAEAEDEVQLQLDI
jgi:segregation and condensation protein B